MQRDPLDPCFRGKTLAQATALAPSDQRFIWLDLVRGLCAVLVCAGHLRSAMLVDYSALGAASWAHKTIYLLTSLGHESVMVFFVLSGFFVGGAVLKNGTHFDWAKYSIARLSRLWVVLIPALLATLMVDQLISVLAPGVLSGEFRSTWNSGPSSEGIYSSTVTTFIANILFLQTVVAPVFGTNDPLWSLANEFWYYVIFPMFAVAFGLAVGGRRLSSASRLVIGFVAMAILLWLPWVIQSEYLIWLLGLIVYRFVGRVSRTKALASCWVGGLFVCASVIYGKLNSLQLALGVPSELLTALSFCVLAVGLTNIKNNDQLPSWIQIIVRTSSDISFSLYVIHFPLVVLIAGYFYGFEKLRPDAAGLTQYTLWLGFILIFSACFWWMFERRTNSIRRGVTLAMESRFGWRLNS